MACPSRGDRAAEPRARPAGRGHRGGARAAARGPARRRGGGAGARGRRARCPRGLALRRLRRAGAARPADIAQGRRPAPRPDHGGAGRLPLGRPARAGDRFPRPDQLERDGARLLPPRGGGARADDLRLSERAAAPGRQLQLVGPEGPGRGVARSRPVRCPGRQDLEPLLHRSDAGLRGRPFARRLVRQQPRLRAPRGVARGRHDRRQRSGCPTAGAAWPRCCSTIRATATSTTATASRPATCCAPATGSRARPGICRSTASPASATAAPPPRTRCCGVPIPQVLGHSGRYYPHHWPEGAGRAIMDFFASLPGVSKSWAIQPVASGPPG